MNPIYFLPDLYIILFSLCNEPMYRIEIAFKDFIAIKGIVGSPWVEFKQLESFSILIYKPYFPEQVYPPVIFTQEEQEILSTLKTDIHGYVDQMVAKWISGEESIDDKWDAYVEQLNKMGLNDLLDIYQKAYNRYYGK